MKKFFEDRDERDMKIVKIVLITAGIVLAVAAATFAIYKIAKKRFKINFECEDCDFSDDELTDEDDGFAPEFVAEAKDDAGDIFDEIEKEAE